MTGYTLWGRAGWGSAIVEAQLAWYGLPFTFEPVEDLFRTPDASANPYAGLLAYADRFIVTGDSISMISEAVTSEKKVMVFNFGKNGLPDKHRRFQEFLYKEGAAVPARVHDFKDRYRETLEISPSGLAQSERERLLRALKEIL